MISVFFGVNVYMQTPTSEFNQGHSTVKMVYICSVQLCVHLPRCTRPYSSLKVDKSIAGTSPRYRFMVTMEPGTRQMKFFDTKLQMFENLNFVQKNHYFSNRNFGKYSASVGIISEGKKRGR